MLDYTKSDAWSLGLVLYTLLSEEEAFTVDDHRKFCAETYREISQERCDQEVAAVVRSLLSADPATRMSAHGAHERLLQLRANHYERLAKEVQEDARAKLAAAGESARAQEAAAEEERQHLQRCAEKAQSEKTESQRLKQRAQKAKAKAGTWEKASRGELIPEANGEISAPGVSGLMS